MPSKKSGQVQVTFNWIYVLIAGAVILMFFIGLVVKQKAVSEERLTGDVVRLMESVFTAAGVSEKTKNFLDTSGLAGYTLYFDCSNGVGEYGIKDALGKTENALEPIFSPLELRTSQLIVWSLPYKLPYKIIDLLMVTSVNTKYFLRGDPSFAVEFRNATAGFNMQIVPTAAKYNDLEPGKNFQVRIVDLDGTVVQPGGNVPVKLQALDKERVTAVSFSLMDGMKTATYYQMDNSGRWKKIGPSVPILSLGEKRDAATYAAIFAQDGERYSCNMRKVFKRLKYVNQVYQGKLSEAKLFYQTHLELPVSSYCLNQIKDIDKNIEKSLELHQINSASCLIGLDGGESLEFCDGLLGSARDIKQVNGQLAVNCITLY